jgi:pimeloyl-ACP methyl ester carboxylesterase
MRPPAANGPPPFNAIESRYIIGLSFRLILRDAIFSSQSRNNLGVLQTPLSKWQRQAAYDEISQFSYHDYVTRFVFPYYQKRGVNQADFKRYSTLHHIGSALRHNPKVRLVTNRNDFLLAPGDIEWMRATLGDKRLKILPNGGHLGNLASPEVRDTLTDFLADPPSGGGAR